jgi:hypothetical protein
MFAPQIVFSQPVAVTGMVKVESGYPVSGVLIKGKKEKIQALTDSMGIFKIGASPYSVLIVSYAGFKSLEIKVADKPIDTVIILLPENEGQKYDAASSKIKSENLQDAISAQKGASNTIIYNNAPASGAFFPQFSSKEESQGSKYLFHDWVSGFIVTADSNTIKNDLARFNYNKMSGNLIMTQDGKSAIEFDHAQITAFTLYNAGTEYPFEDVPSISTNAFCQVIAKGNKYAAYKLTTTKFVKSNYHTDGMTSTGNPYDEYIDEHKYYLLTPADNKFELSKLNKKSIKGALKNEQQRVDDYFSQHKAEIVDEAFLKNLVDYLNH